jgi:hypothetical protein
MLLQHHFQSHGVVSCVGATELVRLRENQLVFSHHVVIFTF